MPGAPPPLDPPLLGLSDIVAESKNEVETEINLLINKCISYLFFSLLNHLLDKM